jgi:hypothetical protein
MESVLLSSLLPGTCSQSVHVQVSRLWYENRTLGSHEVKQIRMVLIDEKVTDNTYLSHGSFHLC